MIKDSITKESRVEISHSQIWWDEESISLLWYSSSNSITPVQSWENIKVLTAVEQGNVYKMHMHTMCVYNVYVWIYKHESNNTKWKISFAHGRMGKKRGQRGY